MRTPNGERSGSLSLTCAFKSRLFIHRFEYTGREREEGEERKDGRFRVKFNTQVRDVVGVGSLEEKSPGVVPVDT